MPFPSPPAYCIRRGRLGWVIVFWLVFEGKPKICRVCLSGPSSSPENMLAAAAITSRPGICREIKEIADRLEAFLNGVALTFSLDLVLLQQGSRFHQAVWRADHGIPRGWVSTYQLIARFIGNPQAGRAVGKALAANPFPIIIPCHRVIRADRALGGFQGGQALKRALLEAEGIIFDHGGRVQVDSFYYNFKN